MLICIQLWLYLEAKSIWFLDAHFQKKLTLAEAIVSIKLCSGMPNQVVGLLSADSWHDGPGVWMHISSLRWARRGLCYSASVNPRIGSSPWLVFVIIHLARNCMKWNSLYSFKIPLKLHSRDIAIAKIDRAIFLPAKYDIKLVKICLAAILLFPKRLGIM